MLSRSMRVNCAIRRISLSSTLPPSGAFCISMTLSSGTKFFEDLVELLFKCCRSKALHHVAIGTRLCSRNNVFLLGFGSAHQHRKLAEIGVGTNGLEHVEAVHIGHVPVRNHELEVAVTQLLETHGTVFGLVNVFEPKVLEQILDDPTHGRKIINNQNFHG